MTENEGREEKVAVARVMENKVAVARGYGQLLERGFGKDMDGRLELAFVEAAYLLEKGRIKAKRSGKALNLEKFLAFGMEKDKRLHERYVVYKDLRERGLLVKTGFKFGCDFRVYKRGVRVVRKGPKAPEEHTRWVVHCVPEDYTCSFQELSRAVRLAHSIRATMLWAIVDNENNVTYYQVTRETV
ncbi:MAG: tRNA-intron lyase [Candidatus Aenigmarchaeota archaeon]|nr:tRNA-intron lyase [Candidatus Aenigmarchaeota archaeon]